MRTAAWSVAMGLAFLIPTTVNGETRKEQLILFGTQVRVEVDAQGHVGTVTPDPALSPPVAKAVQELVSGWRFDPPARDGHVAGGVTFLQLAACAVPVGGSYQFAVALYSSGPARSGPPAPLIPVRMLRAGRSLSFKLNYRVLPDGTAQIDDIVFVNGGNPGDHRIIRESVQSWFRASKFEPEQLDGKPVATRMSLPIAFESGQRIYSSRSAAQAASAKQHQERALEHPSCKAAMAANRSEDRQIALDSPFQLAPGG